LGAVFLGSGQIKGFVPGVDGMAAEVGSAVVAGGDLGDEEVEEGV
jgi:hypothetical protein